MGSQTQLKVFIEETFSAAGGSLSFERFMELALYAPDFGYYSANICDVGGDRADFSTWATLADLGKPIANWIRSEIELFDSRSQPIPLIEIGAGDGSLARGLLKEFGWLERRKLDYHIVDRSGPLRDLQEEKLKGKRVAWHDSMTDALAQCNGRAIIFSNELIDAFPVKWLRWNGDLWEEIFVSYSAKGGLSEVFKPSDLEISWENPPRGQRIEIHESYQSWQDEWLPHFKSGSLLSIDYGSPSIEEVYAGKPHGSLRAYHRQQRIERGGVYQRFGKQDLTCDVNFSEVIEHGKRRGLQTIRLENQLNFMQRNGACEITSTEAAEAFQVLLQRKAPIDLS